MIFEKVRELVAKELGVDKATVTLETRLSEDLGADSLDAVELIMAIEDEFEIQVSDEDSQNMRTIKDIVDFIEKK